MPKQKIYNLLLSTTGILNYIAVGAIIFDKQRQPRPRSEWAAPIWRIFHYVTPGLRLFTALTTL